jgi:hypothetical protein
VEIHFSGCSRAEENPLIWISHRGWQSIFVQMRSAQDCGVSVMLRERISWSSIGPLKEMKTGSRGLSELVKLKVDVIAISLVDL